MKKKKGPKQEYRHKIRNDNKFRRKVEEKKTTRNNKLELLEKKIPTIKTAIHKITYGHYQNNMNSAIEFERWKKTRILKRPRLEI